MNSNPYDDVQFAQLYDWINAEQLEDVPFYSALSAQYGENILELGCGTGRLMLPLARIGCRITGIESAAAMLDILNGKIQNETPETQERITIHAGNLLTWDTEERYDIVCFPYASFFHLHTWQERETCLKQMKRFIRPGGAVVVDIYTPGYMEERPIGDQVLLQEGINPFSGLTAKVVNEKTAMDIPNHTVSVKEIYTEEQPDGTQYRKLFLHKYTYGTGHEMDSLFRHAEYGPVKVYGTYAGDELMAGDERMIFVGTPETTTK